MQHVFLPIRAFTAGRPGSSAIDSGAIKKRCRPDQRRVAAKVGLGRLHERPGPPLPALHSLYSYFHSSGGSALQRDDLLPLWQSPPDPQCPLLLSFHPDRPSSSRPPFPLETPLWRLDPSCRRRGQFFYRALTDQADFASPLHPTLLDCLRKYTAPDEVDGVRCEGSLRRAASSVAADCSTPFSTPPFSPTSRSPAIPSRWASRTAVTRRKFEKNSRTRCTACAPPTTSTPICTSKTPTKRST